MLGTLLIGVVGGAVGMFFIAKNNKSKFTAALGMDIDNLVKMLLNEAKDSEEVKDFIDKIVTEFKEQLPNGVNGNEKVNGVIDKIITELKEQLLK